MRFVQFRLLRDVAKATRIGILKPNGKLVDLSTVLANSCSLVEAVTKYGIDTLMKRAATQLVNQVETDPKSCKILSPIVSPGKVACVGLNYKDHCKEMNMETPAEPIFFSKFPSSIIGPYDDIPYPNITQELDWEAELAVVIGKPGRDIDATAAKDHIFGYTVAHDVSARDWQLHKNGGQWLLGKTMDGFCPLGPSLVTADEIDDPHALAVTCRVNGEVKQNSSTSQLVHGVYDCIAWLSKFCTLFPGDVILTGTPPGVGSSSKPPQFLKKGDVVECEVENIGVIRNQIV